MSPVVALVTDAFGGFGGIAQYNRDFLSALADSPTVQRVITIPRLADGSSHKAPCGIDFQTTGLGGLRPYAVACSKVMASARPSWVLCGHVNLIPFASPIAAFHRVPLALLVYGIDVWQPPRLASRVLLGMVDHVVSISQVTIDKMLLWSRRLSGCPTSLVPNAIDLDRFHPASEKPMHLLERYGLHRKRVLLTLARLVSRERYKGVDEVMELMPELLKYEPDIAYLIVGDGSDLERLRTKSFDLGLAEKVVFAGRIEEEEKLAHYQIADAFVMPGRGEGFGFVFLEAMACGIPVVASILDGSREAVRLGALGELCDPRDRGGTMSAIRKALAKGRGNVPYGLDYFDLPNFRRRVHQFASEMMPG